jgi:hypothetical protein
MSVAAGSVGQLGSSATRAFAKFIDWLAAAAFAPHLG